MQISLLWLPPLFPPTGSKEVSQHFKVTLGSDGFFQEAHVKLRPVEFAADGVYLCGMAQYPKHITEAINQAYGAAGRVLTLLSHDTVVASGSQIADFLEELLHPAGVAVVREGLHLCASMRGVRKHDARMTTSAMPGYFRKNIATRQEFLDSISRGSAPLF